MPGRQWGPKVETFCNITGLSNAQSKGSGALCALRKCTLPQDKASRVGGDKVAVSEKSWENAWQNDVPIARKIVSLLRQVEQIPLLGSDFMY